MLDDRTVLDHRTMLADTRRMTGYRAALRATCADRVVAEIGTGLGPLALYALQAGASRVYGVELDPRTLALATQLLAAHGFGPDRFVPICGRSDEIELAEPVDLLVCEILDSIGVGENALFYVEDARRRWLRPGGAVIPRALEVDVALADSAEFARERAFWGRDLTQRGGIDFGPIAEQLLAPRRSLTVDAAEVLTSWARWQALDLQAGDPTRRSAVVYTQALRDGTAEGIVVAFRADLGGGIELRTHPEAPPTHWQQGWLPLPGPIDVRAGQVHRIELDLPSTLEPWAPVQALLDLVSATELPEFAEPARKS